MAPADMDLDTIVATETPEGIVLEQHPAGLTARCYAFLLDLLLRLIAIYLFAIGARFAGGIGLAATLIFIFGLEWLYPVVFELSSWGATPGKRAVGLIVILDNGLPITPAASLTRNLLRAADFLPFAYGFAVICMLVRRDFKRLGDVAAGTLVAHRAGEPARVAASDIPPVAPAIAVAPRDQAAIIALAARAPQLTAARVDELAQLAARVSGDAGKSGPDVTRRVLGVAQWFLGRR